MCGKEELHILKKDSQILKKNLNTLIYLSNNNNNPKILLRDNKPKIYGIQKLLSSIMCKQ